MTRKLINASILLTAFGVLSGALGYGFQIVMGTILPPQDYALLVSLLSASTILLTPAYAIFTVLSREVSRFLVRGPTGLILKLYSKYQKKCYYSGGVLILLTLLFNTFFEMLIKGAGEIDFLILSLIITLNMNCLLNNSILQARQKFEAYSWLGLMLAICKISFCVLLVYICNDVTSALFGYFIALLLVDYFGRKSAMQSSVYFDRVNDELFDLTELHVSIKKFLPIFASLFSMSMLTQIDVILANNFFNQEASSSFAAAAVLGKAILYLPSGLVLALFPMVSEAHEKREGVYSYMLIGTLWTLVLCLCAATIFYFFSEQLVSILFSDKYPYAGAILKYYGYAMLPLALLIVAEYYLMAMGNVVFAWLIIIFMPIQFLFLFQYHKDYIELLIVFGFSGLSMLLIGYFIMYQKLKGCFI